MGGGQLVEKMVEIRFRLLARRIHLALSDEEEGWSEKLFIVRLIGVVHMKS